jgi:protein tyrosine/serine phosphatase
MDVATTGTAPEGAPSRHIALEGAVNFRDLGGYRAADGRHVRWRTLFRADGLSNLTPADHAVIRRLGVATVVDLRTTFEVERGRFPVEEIPVGFHHVPLLEAVPEAEAFERAPGFLATQYREIAAQAAPRIGEILRLLARRHAHPVVVHCTAGKDRTGVLVAVLLGILGVDDETIVADYALSARAMATLRQRLAERYPEARPQIEQATELFSAEPSNISSLLTDLRRRHGSIDGYARSAGVGDGELAALRDVLLG